MVVNDPEARIVGGQFICDLPGAVGTAVIEDQQFVIREPIADRVQDSRDSPREVVLLVQCRNNNGDRAGGGNRRHTYPIQIQSCLDPGNRESNHFGE